MAAFLRNIGMGHLAQGMRPGIGSPGAMDLSRLGTDGTQGLLQTALHGSGPGLNLPTLKMSASIGHNHF
jgi:hypothetical protein